MADDAVPTIQFGPSKPEEASLALSSPHVLPEDATETHPAIQGVKRLGRAEALLQVGERLQGVITRFRERLLAETPLQNLEAVDRELVALFKEVSADLEDSMGETKLHVATLIAVQGKGPSGNA